MENNLKERAEKLLKEYHLDSSGDICRNYNQSDIIDAMIQLANEINEQQIKNAIIYGYNLCANASIAQADIIHYNFDTIVNNYIQTINK